MVCLVRFVYSFWDHGPIFWDRGPKKRTVAQKEKETIKAAKREKGMDGLAGKILFFGTAAQFFGTAAHKRGPRPKKKKTLSKQPNEKKEWVVSLVRY